MPLRQLCEMRTRLSDPDIAILETVEATLQLTADLTGSDLFIDCLGTDGKTALVVAEAKPSGDLSAYDCTVLGKVALPQNEPAVYHALHSGMVVRDLKAITQENRAVRQDVAPLRAPDGRILGLLIREKDVSGTLRRERKFQELAREREDATDAMLRLAGREGEKNTVAMREIHHRVKNNLQMVASILNIQARKAKDPQMKRAFRENTNRVLSIAAIHDILTDTATQDAVELKALLEKIRRNIQSIGAGGREVLITIGGDDLWVSSDKATSIALVVNELLTNSLEHGFEGRAKGRVTVTLQQGCSNSTIVVEDDGNGFEPELQHRDSLGLEIITLTVRDKLGGSLQIHSGAQGTRAMFDFH